MRTKKFIFNSLSAVVLQFFTLLSGLILPRIILSSFGSEINGLVSSITQIISYFTLVEAGISGSVIFSLYEPLVKKDFFKVSSIVTAGKKYYYKTGRIFLTCVIIFSFIYAFSVNASFLSKIEILILALVIGMSGTIDFFLMAKYRVLLTADQKTYVLYAAQIIYVIINTLIIYYLAVTGFSILIVRAVALCSVLVRSFILYIYVKTKYTNVNFHAEPDNSSLSKRWDALILEILGVVRNATPMLLATLFTSLKTVSLYAVYLIVTSGIRQVLSIFETGLPSAFGEVIASKDIKKLQTTNSEFETIYYSLITIIYSVALIMFMPFISIYTRGITDANYINPLLAFLFITDAFTYNLKTPQGMLVISAGLYKETRTQTTIQAAIIVILGFLLTPALGLTGIMIASISANIYRTIDLLFFIPKHVTQITYKYTFFKIIKSISIFSITSVFVYFNYNNLYVNDWITWIIRSLLITIFYSIVMLLVLVITDRSNFFQLLSRIRLLRRDK